MRIVFERVCRAKVDVENKTVGEIGAGAVLYVGVAPDDDENVAVRMAQKIARMRVFSDADDKMNMNVTDAKGSILAIPNFTLCADCSHSNRPSFSTACEPRRAAQLYDRFCAALEECSVPLQRGVFGADMKVNVTNDGPVTFVLDSREVIKQK